MSLKVLDFSNYVISNKHLSIILKAFPELSNITINQKIEDCSILSNVSNSIKTLTLSYLSLERSTGFSFPQLEELTLYNVNKIGVSSFSCPMLRKFVASNCEKCEEFIFCIFKQNENTIEDFEI